VTVRLGDPEFLLPERKARIDEVVAQRTRTLTVVMEAFCDPQNVNAVLRTCEAFGIQELHVIEGPMKAYDRNKKIS
jgi:tRNA (guanosine-2'-O-)-methyltransferase